MRPIAFCVFQSQTKGSYLHDGEVSIRSGRLREAGVRNDIFEVVLDEQGGAGNDALLDELSRRILDGGYGLVALQRIWDPALAEALRSRLAPVEGPRPLLVFTPRKRFGESPDPYDLVIPDSSVHVLEALARAPDPLEPSGIPGVRYRGTDGAWADARGRRDAEPPARRWTWRPNFERIRLNPDAAPDATHLVVYGNPGCPYRTSIRKIDFWKDLELDPAQTNTKGCSFCNINLAEDYEFIKGIAVHVDEQLANIQQAVPGAREVILLDQDPFPYLPELFDRLAAREAPPIHLLIQARADLFLKRKSSYEGAMAKARAGGHRMTPFLIGIENFHQPTLDLYNKGVTVDTNVEVLAYLQDCVRRFGDVIDANRVSPGFILWHPWVTFESLRTNLAAIDRFGLSNFRSESALSKIRLYPDIPFYWKAKEDGLLEAGYADKGLDSASRYGYPQEAPYRFAQPDAQAAYTLLAILCRRFEPIHELRLLGLVLDWVEAHPGVWSTDAPLALQAPDDLVARFLADHEAGVQALRKQHTQAHRARAKALDASLEAELRALLDPVWTDGEAAPGGFVLAQAVGGRDRVQLFFAAPDDAAAARHDGGRAAFRLIIEPRSDAPRFAQTSRFNLSYAASERSREVGAAIKALCRRIRDRDRPAA